MGGWVTSTSTLVVKQRYAHYPGTVPCVSLASAFREGTSIRATFVLT